MNKLNKHKVKKLIVLFSLFISLTLINLVIILPIHWDDENLSSKFHSINEDSEVNTLVSSQSLNYSGPGSLINITLHQSLFDSTTKQFSNLDQSNIFTEPFPIFTGYNTSFINVSINNINAPNKSIILEDDYSWQQSLASRIWSSFEVRGHGFLENVSIKIVNDAGNEDYNIRLYNGELHSYLGTNYIRPKTSIATLSLSETVLQTTGSIWLNLTRVHERLNVSDTYNNTFFIAVQRLNDYGEWEFENQADGDDTIVWDSLSANTPVSRDQLLKVDVAPLSNTPKPSEINLKVNGTEVNDIDSDNRGFMNSSSEFYGINGYLDFEITADWWDVSCDVIKTQINYSKSDIKANSEFYIPSSSSEVQWNVTVPSGLNYFDERIIDFNTINFTIPSNWIDTTIKVFNSSTEKTSDLVKRLLNSKYREVQVLNAGNGTFWYLTANSSNLLSSIDTYIDDIAISPSYIANFSSLIEFVANFSISVNDGFLNLSVYSPSPRYMNNTKLFDISTAPGKEISIDNWTASLDIKDYGEFLILMLWNNDTAAGFLEDYITIFADTDIITFLPRTTFDASELFDIEIYFNDTGLIEGIDGGLLNYSINGNPIRGDKIDYTRAANGYYNISIDCNDTQFFNYGDNIITFNISKPFYNNQTDSVTIRINGETNAVITSPSAGSIYNSSETINLTIYYNNTVRNIGIDGAIINYSLNNGLSYRSGFVDNSDGTYDIAINAADPDFNGYGVKTIIVNTSKQYYYNQSESISITIIGETSLNAIKIPDQTSYNASEAVVIQLYYNDTVKDLPIDGATISYEIEGMGLRYDSIDPVSIGLGYYEITIDCNDTNFNGYGLKSVEVYANSSFYYNQSLQLSFFILGETDLTTLKVPDQSSYNASETMLIRLYFNDIVKNVPIDGATISYEIEGQGLRFDHVDTSSIGSGYYDIQIDCNDTDFNGYGVKTVTIYSNSTYYHNQSRVVSLRILGETSLSVALIPDQYAFNASDLFTIRMYFNDTIKNVPVDGATVFYEIEGMGLRYDEIDLISIGLGYYDIEIDCNDTDFNGYGWKSITVYIEIANYHNQSQLINIQIFGETSLSIEKLPDQVYYDSSETMVVRVYFNDTVKDLPITGGILTYTIGSGSPRFDAVDLFNGFYDITIDCNDIDLIYGPNTIFISLDKQYYNNQSTQTSLLVVGFTVLRILNPDNLTAYYSGQSFNITVEYYDTIKGAGVTGATLSYLLPTSGSLRFDNIFEIGSGIYRIEISVNDIEFDAFGYVDVTIFSNQKFYLNRSNTFTFHRQITTEITPDPPGNIIDLGSILCGLNRTYTFNYSATTGIPVLNANYALIGSDYNFLFHLQENGDGNYTFHFDTTFVDVSGSPFALYFNISAYGKQTQILQITIDVLIIYTDIVNPDWDDVILRNAGLNQTFTFYFNDTVNDRPVLNLDTSNVLVRNEGTGLLWNTGDFNWELINSTILGWGNYELRISLNGL
ncbi:MAG: hypothetical protein FK734_15260, partial [Asgard group archaeon]|nr:hypothetical protein [Asgard group archaeon]